MNSLSRSLSACMMVLALSGSTLTLAAPPADAPGAAPAAAKAELPTAKAVFDKYVEATGGAAAYGKLTSRVSKGTMEVSPMGMKGTLTISQGAPNKFLMASDIAGVGSSQQGFDGSTVWSIDPTTGGRIVDGAERASFVNRSQFNLELDMLKVYPKSEVLGSEVVEGQDCWKVKVGPETGDPMTYLYSKSSGLLLVTRGSQESQMGKIEFVTTMSDYREVDGIKFPFKMVTKPSGFPATIIMTIDSAQHNTKIDDKTFAPPQEVLDLKPGAEDAKPAAPEGTP